MKVTFYKNDNDGEELSIKCTNIIFYRTYVICYNHVTDVAEIPIGRIIEINEED